MTKEQYTEHCRELFENPLIDFGSIYVKDESVYTQRNFIKDDVFIGIAILDFPWKDSVISSSDFEKGGKYYREVQNDNK